MTAQALDRKKWGDWHAAWVRAIVQALDRKYGVQALDRMAPADEGSTGVERG